MSAPAARTAPAAETAETAGKAGGTGGPRALRAGRVSFRVRPRAVLVVPAGLAVLALLMAVDIGRGDFPIGVGDVVRALLGDPEHRFVVMELRLPRVLTGALVGAAFGLAGALTQSITRNPLASPDTLGISQAASVVVAAITVATGSAAGGAGGALASVGIPFAALAGGLAGGVLVYLLAWRQGLDGYRLVLVGIGFAGVAANVKWWLLALGDVNDAGRAMAWITGSLNARGWEHVRPVALALAVLVPLVLIGAFALGTLRLGDEPARGLGLRVNLDRSLLILAAIVLASIATAAAGPIEFVALAAPQIALRLAGTGQPPLVGSTVTGAALTVGADVIARTAFGAVELPVGVVTAVLGAPLLLYLLVRSRRKATL